MTILAIFMIAQILSRSLCTSGLTFYIESLPGFQDSYRFLNHVDISFFDKMLIITV